MSCGVKNEKGLPWNLEAVVEESQHKPQQKHLPQTRFAWGSDSTGAAVTWVTDKQVQFSSVQSLSRVQLFVIPWTTACQASLSITNSQSLFKLISIESVMASNHLNLCCPLLFLPSVFPRIKIYSSELVIHIGWPEDWCFSSSISASNEYFL